MDFLLLCNQLLVIVLLFVSVEHIYAFGYILALIK